MTNPPTPVPYSFALAKLEAVATQQRTYRHTPTLSLPLDQAIGKIAACDHVSPESTPQHDTSAMDGFAIRSKATAGASAQAPVQFRVRPGVMIAAGDPPSQHSDEEVDDDHDDEAPPWCVEIATGAIFPAGFDACVRYEDITTRILPPKAEEEEEDEPEHPSNQHYPRRPRRPPQIILVTKPVEPNANRRMAGCDMQIGQTLLRAGEMVDLAHLLPLAAVGYSSSSSCFPSSLLLSLVRAPRVGILSTGKELLREIQTGVRDVNGPYLTATARAVPVAGAEADFLGTVDDDAAELRRHLESAVSSERRYDAILTSGGVSRGRFDHVRAVLEEMNAEIIFHGLAMRPGHPVLSALLPSSCEEEQVEDSLEPGPRDVDDNARKRRMAVPFFGLPGNPVAAAACYRFLVVPYLRTLQGQERETPLVAKLVSQPGSRQEKGMEKKECGTQITTDRFRHGLLHCTPEGTLNVEISTEQSPAKLGPLSSVNCWVHLRPGQGGSVTRRGGEIVECYPFSRVGIL